MLQRITRLLAVPASFLLTVFFIQWALSLFGVHGVDGKAAGAITGILVTAMVIHSSRWQ